ncbi:MAG: hypothetical protein AAB225_30000 [Acidobacteriota bacterium]
MSVLADLASCFRDKPENIATSALYHILRNHDCTRKAFLALARSVDERLPEDLSIYTQERDQELGQPDLLGRDDAGRTLLAAEMKFWAPLTPNQPVSYLKLLERDGSGCVLFVAPAERVAVLFEQLKEACRTAGLAIENETPFRCRIGQQVLGVLKLSDTLERMRQAAKQAGDEEAVSDVYQLQSLCRRYEEEAFLPLRPEELTDLDFPRRLLAMSGLVDKVVRAGQAQGLWRSLSVRSDYSSRGAAVYVGPWLGYFAFNVAMWRRRKVSPFWLSTKLDWPENRKLSAEERNKIRQALHAVNGHLFVETEGLFAPLLLRPGVEEELVIEHLLSQIRRLCDDLVRLGFSLETPPASAPDERSELSPQ